MIGYTHRQLEDGKFVFLPDERKVGKEKISNVEWLRFRTCKPFEDDNVWLKEMYNEEYVPVYALPNEPSEDLIDRLHSRCPLCLLTDDRVGTCAELTRKMYKAFIKALNDT